MVANIFTQSPHHKKSFYRPAYIDIDESICFLCSVKNFLTSF